MKKVLLFLVLCSVPFAVFAGGESENAEKNAKFGESEILFSYDGPGNVSISLYQDGKLIGTMNSGGTKKIIVADGDYTFEVRTCLLDAKKEKVTEDLELAKRLRVSALDSRASVNIVARKIRSKTVFRDFSVTGAVTLNLSPEALPAGEYITEIEKSKGQTRQKLFERAISLYPDNPIFTIATPMPFI